MRLAKSSILTARLHPLLRCVCGRALSARDFDLDNMSIKLVCSRCHQTLQEIEVRVIDENGDRW